MSDRVVVLTGASSGMGRAAARRFASRGDAVVVAARRADALQEVVRECEAVGGRVLAVPAAVTDPRAVEDVAEQALAQFGRLDAWVHLAAVAVYGKLDEVPPDVARKVIETNLSGAAFVLREAVRRFKAQGRGHLVVIASALGKAPIPYLGIYNASKFGVVGLCETARTELRMDGLDDRIHVSTLLPPAVDTPFYLHAANFVGKVPRPPPPVYAVDQVAEGIVELVDEPRGEVAFGAAGKLMVASHKVAPGLFDAAVGPYARTMFLEDHDAPLGPGAVFAPMREGRTPDGGWKRGDMLERRADWR